MYFNYCFVLFDSLGLFVGGVGGMGGMLVMGGMVNFGGSVGVENNGG